MADELSQSNASELTQTAEELGATVLRGLFSDSKGPQPTQNGH